MSHSFGLRVYYEDTDFGGIVYYANYLRFIERARSEWVRALGIDQLALKAERGLVFAVRRLEADYLQPALFDDLLTVRTRLADLSGARFTMDQTVLRDTTPLFAATVTIVMIDARGRPTRLPADIAGPIRAEAGKNAH